MTLLQRAFLIVFALIDMFIFCILVIVFWPNAMVLHQMVGSALLFGAAFYFVASGFLDIRKSRQHNNSQPPDGKRVWYIEVALKMITVIGLAIFNWSMKIAVLLTFMLVIYIAQDYFSQRTKQ
jgi:hypothetical protein